MVTDWHRQTGKHRYAQHTLKKRYCADCSADISGSQSIRCITCRLEHRKKVDRARYAKNKNIVREGAYFSFFNRKGKV